MSIVGATVIEDSLQDEVPLCIQQFKQAGIKVWVLTGDKLQTAINIGKSVKLLHPSDEQIVIEELHKRDLAVFL